jgi:UDP-N-acetylglucosamine acyltransferase
MVGGAAGLSMDLAPYCMAANRNEVHGLNIVGLRRGGFKREEIAEIKRLFHAVFGNGDSPRANAAAIDPATVLSAPGRKFIEFFQTGKRGFVRPAGAVEDAE